MTAKEHMKPKYWVVIVLTVIAGSVSWLYYARSQEELRVSCNSSSAYPANYPIVKDGKCPSGFDFIPLYCGPGSGVCRPEKTATTPPSSGNELKDWETYTNSTYGLGFKYPANEYTKPSESQGGIIGIANFFDDRPGMEPGQYSIEIADYPNDSCLSGLESVDKIQQFPGAKIYFGISAVSEGVSETYVACIERAGSQVFINVAERDEKYPIAHKIFETLILNN